MLDMESSDCRVCYLIVLFLLVYYFEVFAPYNSEFLSSQSMQQIISLLVLAAARSRCRTTFVSGDFAIVHYSAVTDDIFLQHVHLITIS